MYRKNANNWILSIQCFYEACFSQLDDQMLCSLSYKNLLKAVDMNMGTMSYLNQDIPAQFFVNETVRPRTNISHACARLCCSRPVQSACYIVYGLATCFLNN